MALTNSVHWVYWALAVFGMACSSTTVADEESEPGGGAGAAGAPVSGGFETGGGRDDAGGGGAAGRGDGDAGAGGEDEGGSTSSGSASAGGSEGGGTTGGGGGVGGTASGGGVGGTTGGGGGVGGTTSGGGSVGGSGSGGDAGGSEAGGAAGGGRETGGDSGVGGGGGDGGDTGGGSSAGGSGGEGGAPPLEVTLAPLPDATFNVDYSTILIASGGGDHSYELLSPTDVGLSLSSDGVLAGRPTRAGTLELEIRVRDGERGAVLSVSLRVIRKPWFAFRVHSGTSGGGTEMIYLKNVYRSTAPVRALTTVTSTTSLDRFAFSPDGNRFAFTADVTTAGADDLYLIDTAGDTVTTGTRITDHGAVSDFAWSPSSRDIALAANVGGTYRVLHVDLTEAPPVVATLVTDAGGSVSYLSWVNDDHLAYVANGQVYALRRESNGSFSELGALALGTNPLSGMTADPAVERLFTTRTYCVGGAGCSTSHEVVDLTDPAIPWFTVSGLSDYTADFALGFHCGSPPEVIELVPGRPQVAAFVGAYCTAQFAESPRAVYYADGSRVRRQRFTGTSLEGDPEVVPGTYTPSLPGSLRLSPRDEWVVFTGDKAVYASRVAGSTPTPAVLVSGEFTAGTTGLGRLEMAPTSRAFVYTGDPASPGIKRPYYVNLETNPISAPRDLVGAAGSGWIDDRYLAYSRDSAIVAYAFQASESNCPELHLVNLLEDNAVGRDPLMSYSPNGTCSTAFGALAVASGMSLPFAFQP